MARSPTEQIREIALEVRAIVERETALRDHLADYKNRDERREREVAELRAENVELRREPSDSRQENAVLRQQLDDHIKHTELSDSRRWALIVALVGALLSLASGLIVTLAKK